MRPAKLLIPAALAAAISVFSGTCGATVVNSGHPSLEKGTVWWSFTKPSRVRPQKGAKAAASGCTAAATTGSGSSGRSVARRGASQLTFGHLSLSGKGKGKGRSAPTPTTQPCSGSTAPGGNDGSPESPNTNGAEILPIVFGPGIFGDGGNQPFGQPGPGGDTPETGNPGNQPNPPSPNDLAPTGDGQGLLGLILPIPDLNCVPGFGAPCPRDPPQHPQDPHTGPGTPFGPGGPTPAGLSVQFLILEEEVPEVFEAQANVPEPASLGLLALGLAAIGYQRRKRSQS
jgi:hypothetical protein